MIPTKLVTFTVMGWDNSQTQYDKCFTVEFKIVCCYMLTFCNNYEIYDNENIIYQIELYIFIMYICI